VENEDETEGAYSAYVTEGEADGLCRIRASGAQGEAEDDVVAQDHLKMGLGIIRTLRSGSDLTGCFLSSSNGRKK
jgi:hypothetical protein